MGQTSANMGDPNGVADHATRIGNELVDVDRAFRYHHGNAGIDTTSPVVHQAGLQDLHDAAVQSESAFLTTAAGVWGAWWTNLLAAADAAGLQGTLDDPRRVLRAQCSRPVRVTIL